jgi:hypothetical protein
MLFDPIIPQEFENDVVVVAHEAGHVVTWFCMGERIELMEFTRILEGLKGRTRIGFHVPHAADSEGNARCFAERLLAGEAAGRRAVHDLPKDRICSFGVNADTLDNVDDVLAKLFEFQGRNGCSPNENLDVTQVVRLARRHAGARWHEWVAERLKGAQARVDANWAAIDALVIWLAPKIPTEFDVPKQVDGKQIVDFLMAFGVRTTAPSIAGQGWISRAWDRMFRA